MSNEKTQLQRIEEMLQAIEIKLHNVNKRLDAINTDVASTSAKVDEIGKGITTLESLIHPESD